MAKKLYINEINCTTGEEITREFNSEEYAAHEIQIKQEEITRLEVEAKATAKAALLSKLGITAEEAQLLLS